MQFWVTFAIASAVGAIVAIAIRLLLPRVLAWRGVWFTWHTRFGPALVFDSADEDGTTVRLLNVGGTFQSVCYVRQDLLWDPVCEYHRTWAYVTHATWPLKRTRGKSDNCMPRVSRRALVLGGGGFSFPKWMVAYRPDFVCTTVEIDPKIVSIARKRMFLDELERRFCSGKEQRLFVAVDDAWNFIANDTSRYELIVNDAFGGRRPLGGMDSREGVRLIADHLLPDGVYLGNVRTPLQGKRAQPLFDTYNAFATVFPHVWIVAERPEEPNKLGNNTLIASFEDQNLSTIKGVMAYANKEDGPCRTTQ